MLWLLPALTACNLPTPVDRNCAVRQAYYPDENGDGVGEPTEVYIGCSPPDGWVDNVSHDPGDDTDDTDSDSPPDDTAPLYWDTGDTGWDTAGLWATGGGTGWFATGLNYDTSWADTWWADWETGDSDSDSDSDSDFPWDTGDSWWNAQSWDSGDTSWWDSGS
jgi:hypothetical protein